MKLKFCCIFWVPVVFQMLIAIIMLYTKLIVRIFAKINLVPNFNTIDVLLALTQWRNVPTVKSSVRCACAL